MSGRMCSESSRVVAASANDICDVTIKRQIFVKCNAEQLDCRAVCNLDSGDVDPSGRVDLCPLCASSEQNCFSLAEVE